MRTLKHAAKFFVAASLAASCSIRAADFVVSGVVVDSRSLAPLANARVTLAPTTARDEKLEQVTKKDGAFSFAVRQPGKYSLRMNKPGYPPQGYRQAPVSALQSAIVVRDDQDTGHIVFAAHRGGAINGQIKDEDGEPVPRALVAVFQSSITGGERKVVARGQVRANVNGEFRFPSLPQGNYYVCAMGRPWFANSLIQSGHVEKILNRVIHRANAPKAQAEPAGENPPAGESSPAGDPLDDEVNEAPPEYSPDPVFRGTAFLTTFYPQARSVEQASLIRLDTGGETQIAITLPLAKGVSINGSVTLPAGTTQGRAVLIKKIQDVSMTFLAGVVSKEGTFQFNNVPAGLYEIVATSESGSGASSWIVRQEVDVAGSDMEVTLRPEPMGSLTGRVLFDGEAPESKDNLLITLRDEKGIRARNQIDPDGNYSLSRLPPGHYELTGGSKDYIAAYCAGAGGERLPLTVEVTSGEPVHCDLVLTRAVSVIEGTVEQAAVPQAGVFVLLLPKNPSQKWAYRVDQTDTDGSYRLGTIPAGDYFLIALADSGEVAYRDAKVAAALSKAAAPVHVEPGEHLDRKLEAIPAGTLKLPLL
jgi:hypothetical protein